MLAGTNLESLCSIADTPNQLKDKVKKLYDTEFNYSDVELRKKVLSENYSNQANLNKLLSFLTC